MDTGWSDWSEAEALADIHDGETVDYSDYTVQDAVEGFIANREISLDRDRRVYERNKAAKVGEIILCAENRCQKQFVKKFYQQAFCCKKHKDQYWNRQRGGKKSINRAIKKIQAAWSGTI